MLKLFELYSRWVPLSLWPMTSDSSLFERIKNIHLKLDSLQTLDEGELSQPSFSGTPFTVFQPALKDEIEKLVMKAPSKTRDNDPAPTQVVNACINELLQSISNIVNSSGGLGETKIENI